jgi:hypothetical protein
VHCHRNRKCGQRWQSFAGNRDGHVEQCHGESLRDRPSICRQADCGRRRNSYAQWMPEDPAVRPAAFVAYAVACSILSGCSWYYNTIIIDNRSSSKAYDIIAYHEGNRTRLSDVQAGESSSVWRHFSGEGAARIRFIVDRRRIDKELCYFTGPHTFEARVIISDEDVTVQCD